MNNRSLFGVLLVVGMVGCAGQKGEPGPAGVAGQQGLQGAAGKDASGSGSRLKARFWVGEDGSRQQIGFYDIDRDDKCTFQVGGINDPGVVRCLPSEDVQQNGGKPTAFADALCVGEYADSTAIGEAPPRYVKSVFDGIFWQVGEQIPKAYGIKNGVCEEKPVDAEEWYVLHEVPPAAFAKAEEQVDL